MTMPAMVVPPAAPSIPVSNVSGAATRRLLERFWGNKTPATVAGYGADLDDFRAFLGAPDLIAAADLLLAHGNGEANAIALDYLAHLQARDLAPTTINRRLAALRSLVKSARLIGMVPWDLEVARLQVTPLRDTRGPGVEGVRAMLSLSIGRGDVKGRRDAAILALLYDLGLRRREVVDLDLAHVDLAGGRLSIHGKGRSEREWRTLPGPTRDDLQAWIGVRGDKAGPLFWNLDRSHARGRLTGRGLYAVIRSLGTAAGLRVHPHGLRHTAITDKLDAGGDLRAVQRFSRHRDLRMLVIYDDNRSDIAGELAQQGARRLRAGLAKVTP